MIEGANRLEPINLEANGLQFTGFAAGPADGDLVLLLHGWPEFASSWNAVALDLARAGFRVVAFDQRGYATGARPAEIDAYRLEALESDVLAVADALGRRRFHLAGHDWGAIVGWYLAKHHPERIASYTALSVPHPDAFSAALASDPDQQQRSAYVGIFRAPGHVAEKALMKDDAAPLRAVYETAFSPEHVAENVRRFSEDGCLTASLNWYRANDITKLALGAIDVPTLFVWGSNDRALGERAALDTEHHMSGPYRFERLDGVSHWIPSEAAPQTARFMRDHLAAHAL